VQQRRRACSLLCQRRLAHPRPSRLLADVYMYCAPTRGAFHTGRFPMHLDAVQKNLIPWSMPAGIDLRYEFMPAVLKKAGYQTHHIGKWHQGFFTEAYTPLKRGYDSTFGFLVGGEVRVAALRCAAHCWELTAAALCSLDAEPLLAGCVVVGELLPAVDRPQPRR
jgi:hypothetical protein